MPITSSQPVPDHILTADDLYLFNEGSHLHLFRKLGAHVVERDGVPGTQFAVWAPNAERVAVIGDFNGWDDNANRLEAQDSSGIWTTFVAGIGQGTIYKYRIHSRIGGHVVDKADPFATHAETPPRTGSIVWGLDYEWGDEEWMTNRPRHNAPDAPWSVYELHLGSWMRVPEDGNRSLSYREVAPKLA